MTEVQPLDLDVVNRYRGGEHYHSIMLKAVLFDFNGVIINDEPIHDKLIRQILVEENLRPQPGEFRQFCLGRSDRACFNSLLSNRGRTVGETYLNTLVARKAKMYQRELEIMEKLPIYPGLEDFIFKLRVARFKMAVVSGALHMEIDLVLHRTELTEHFPVIVSGDESLPSKPAPDSYLTAVKRLNQHYPGLDLEPGECLAIEDTFAGIQAAKSAGIPVVGVANSYPFHMLQRRANWTVDYLSDLELERIQDFYAAKLTQPKAG